MSDDFRVGECVQVKTGAPAVMVIEEIGPEINGVPGPQGAFCSWFDAAGSPVIQWYPLTSLKRIGA